MTTPQEYRLTLASLVRRLHTAGARVIAFDMRFPRPSPSDAEFARALHSAPTVLARTMDPAEHESNVPALARAAHRVGYATTENRTGFIGQPNLLHLTIWPERELGGRTYDALSTAIVKEYSGPDWNPPNWMRQYGILLNDLPLATNCEADDVAKVFTFAQSINQLRAVSATNDELAAFAKDAIVIIGATAPIFHDVVRSQAGCIPGIFVQAKAVELLLNGRDLD